MVELRALSASVHTPFGKHLVKEAETLTKFKARVDKVLADLGKSPASYKSLDRQQIPEDAYGKVDSAKALRARYTEIHTHLMELSKTFGDQIEAMGLAALAAERGYGGMDAEQAARLREIEERTREQYRGPGAPSNDASGEKEPKSLGNQKA